jgi:small-conductance mechanosensitive channel
VEWNLVLTVIAPTLIVALLTAVFVRLGAERLLNAAMGDELTVTSPAVRGPLRVITAATFVLTAWLVMPPAFELAGLPTPTGIRAGMLIEWAVGNGPKVLFIGLLAYALIRTTSLLVRRFEHQVSQGTSIDALERAKRARTLGSLIQRVSTISISSAALLMILDQVGVDITPVLTGAGIAGLAVGFGAQTLVRDIISGFFMILEDQVRVGDVASINGVGGLVENIYLRTITLRDEEGTVHVFPNGAITTLANRSKDFSFYVISVALPYNQDTDRVVEVLQEVGGDLQKDPRFAPFILAPIEIMGIDAFGDWSMQLKLRIKTMPLKQWDVGRELRKRMRVALDRAGVRVPFPAMAAVEAEGPRRP